MGYLPAGMRNYLARLGWSHGDDEFIRTEQLIEWFNLGGIGKSPARFDFKKLENLNGQHMREADDKYLLDSMTVWLEATEKAPLTDQNKQDLLKAMASLKARAKIISEIFDLAYFILAARPLMLDDKATGQMNSDNIALLSRLTPVLRNAKAWNAEALQELLRDYAETEGLKLGKVAQPLRAAITGRGVSPGAFDVMETLGQEETLARLADQIK